MFYTLLSTHSFSSSFYSTIYPKLVDLASYMNRYLLPTRVCGCSCCNMPTLYGSYYWQSNRLAVRSCGHTIAAQTRTIVPLFRERRLLYLPSSRPCFLPLMESFKLRENELLRFCSSKWVSCLNPFIVLGSSVHVLALLLLLHWKAQQ